MTGTPQPPTEPTPRRYLIPPHIFWPGVVIALLTMSVIAIAITAMFALSDPSFAVVPDYYNKALKWDEDLARQHQSDSLGWTNTIEYGELDSDSGMRQLIVTLADAAGNPITNANLSATVFHPSRSNDIQTVSFEAAEPGRYIGAFQPTRIGFWEIKLRATHSEGVFIDHQLRWLMSLSGS
jgi:nitrogen fixation protein FixH